MNVPAVARADRAGVAVVGRLPLVREAVALLLQRSSIDVLASVGSLEALDAADLDGRVSVAVLVMPDDSGIAVVPAQQGASWADPARLDQPVVVLDWDVTHDDLAMVVRAPDCRPYPMPAHCRDREDRSVCSRVGLSDLTDREIRMLTLLAEGRTADDAAELLGISRHTARTHIANLLHKLGAHSRLEAVSITRELLHVELESRGVAV